MRGFLAYNVNYVCILIKGHKIKLNKTWLELSLCSPLKCISYMITTTSTQYDHRYKNAQEAIECSIVFKLVSENLSLWTICSGIRSRKVWRYQRDSQGTSVLSTGGCVHDWYIVFVFIIPSPTKLRRDIVTLPSVRPFVTSLWTL